ncbi:uncharacterized protein MONOS_18528 [Monocercomonoides exilis]|uniref:uncharacterized protein n=1 Tax=Monocercomonoides exilis TaxID=2049356 RepID=UPI003559C099|nr:hypothetical protein MONOS_18528 [Monocercomonoides exilis]
MDMEKLLPSEKVKFAAIQKFAETLPDQQKQKCTQLFMPNDDSLPDAVSMEEFSKELSVRDKVLFWKAVNECNDAFNPNLQSELHKNNMDGELLHPEIINQKEFTSIEKELQFEQQTCCEPMHLQKSAIHQIWEASYVAPILDKDGVPSVIHYSRLMLDYDEYLPFLKADDLWNNKTQIQLNLANKAICSNLFLDDRSLGDDQKAVIIEFNRLLQKERDKAYFQTKFYLSKECVNIVSCIFIFIGIMMIFGHFYFRLYGGYISRRMLLIPGVILLLLHFTIFGFQCFASGYFVSLGKKRSLTDPAFEGKLKRVMRPCVEKRVKNWKYKKEWRWIMSKKEQKIAKRFEEMEYFMGDGNDLIIGDEEEEEKKRLRAIQSNIIHKKFTTNAAFEQDSHLSLPRNDSQSFFLTSSRSAFNIFKKDVHAVN